MLTQLETYDSLMDVIRGRRSIRRFQERPVERELLAKLKVFPPANTPPPGALSVGSDDTETLPSKGVIGRH